MPKYIENAISLPGVFTYSYLLVLFGISLVVYFNNHEKTYKYYALYTLMLSVYAFTKSSMPEGIGKIYYEGVHYVFNFFIQIVFHCFYVLFGINFLNFREHFPQLEKKVHIYLLILFTFSLVYYVLVLLGYYSIASYAFYFQVIFLPIHLTLAIFLLIKARTSGVRFYGFLIVGTAAFIVFGIIATIGSINMDWDKENTIRPITYFYIGVIIEATAFALGLGLRIRDVYQEKLKVQMKLSEAQVKLNQEIKEKLKHKEEALTYMTKQREIKELESDLYKLQNKVLRSQMNSHFLFNVLNSIKAFVIENNTAEAVSYLSKFAKFIRKVLDGSMQESTLLSDELETLKLYLEIENMRLSNRVDISFLIEPGLNLNQVKLPSLLLQPFVENSIWHGLAEAGEEKSLEISVKSIKSGVEVSILDNGVGYEKSIAIKQNSIRSKSYGLSLIRERINQFNSMGNSMIDFKISNRGDQTNGTQVVLTITEVKH